MRDWSGTRCGGDESISEDGVDRVATTTHLAQPDNILDFEIEEYFVKKDIRREFGNVTPGASAVILESGG